MQQEKDSPHFLHKDGHSSFGGASNGFANFNTTIMVAEDFTDSRLMIKFFLEMRGYRVVEAVNGQEAAEVAWRERPGLILLDLSLPIVDGFAATRLIRKRVELRNVPIIIISGHDPARYRTAAIAAGCNEYLTKPINLDALDSLVSNLLSNRQPGH